MFNVSINDDNRLEGNQTFNLSIISTTSSFSDHVTHSLDMAVMTIVDVECKCFDICDVQGSYYKVEVEYKKNSWSQAVWLLKALP